MSVRACSSVWCVTTGLVVAHVTRPYSHWVLHHCHPYVSFRDHGLFLHHDLLREGGVVVGEGEVGLYDPPPPRTTMVTGSASLAK